MAARSSNRAAPYEVLSGRYRSTTSAAGDAAADQGQQGQGKPRPGAGQADSAIASWVNRVRQPIVLRIPRGFAVLAGATFFGLVVLAYWVGTQRHRPLVEPAAKLANPSPEVLAARPAENLWYLELTTFFKNPAQPDEHRREAYRCLAFLKKHGVEAAIDSPDNGDLLRVVALPGFEELRTKAYDRNVQRLSNLGQTWKTQHRGLKVFSPRPVQY